MRTIRLRDFEKEFVCTCFPLESYEIMLLGKVIWEFMPDEISSICAYGLLFLVLILDDDC